MRVNISFEVDLRPAWEAVRARARHIGIGAALALAVGATVVSALTVYLHGRHFVRRYEADIIARDFVVATIADRLAGPPRPFSADSNGAAPYPIKDTWGIESNGIWLTDWAKAIVPYFYYEGISGAPLYPEIIAWSYYGGEAHFHIGGQAGQTYPGLRTIIKINERYQQEGLNEQRVLSTLVHELVHVQGGYFSTESYSEDMDITLLETRTQGATLEVLAAMCQRGEDLACSAFWYDIADFAKTSFNVRMRQAGLRGPADFIGNVLWMNNLESTRYAKAMRYWDSSRKRQQRLDYILTTYQQRPWETIILPGICHARPLRTDLPEKVVATPIGLLAVPGSPRLLMHFDDARLMFGGLTRAVACYEVPVVPE